VARTFGARVARAARRGFAVLRVVMRVIHLECRSWTGDEDGEATARAGDEYPSGRGESRLHV